MSKNRMVPLLVQFNYDPVRYRAALVEWMREVGWSRHLSLYEHAVPDAHDIARADAEARAQP
jgi:hypothetical protein